MNGRAFAGGLVVVAAWVGISGCPPSKPSTLCAPGQCTAEQRCIEETGECEALPACVEDADCVADGGTQRCAGGVCTSCSDSIVCGAPYVRCEASTGACAGCADAGDCGGAFPLCQKGSCVQCREDTDCPSSAPACYGFWCARCDENADCASGTFCHGGECRTPCDAGGTCPAEAPRCVYSTAALDDVCVECGTTRDCPQGQGCYRGECRAVRRGDTCSAAIDVDVSSGSALVSAAMNDTGENSELPDVQGDADAIDTFFRFEVTAPSAVTATVAVKEYWPYPVGDAFVELYAGSCGALVRVTGLVTDVFVPPGTYFIRVQDGPQMAWVSAFDLKLTVVPASRPEGNSCFTPIPIVLDGGSATVIGDTRGTQIVHAQPCSLAEGMTDAQFAGRVYGLQIPVRSHVDYTLTPESPDAGIVGVLRGNCFGAQDSYGGCAIHRSTDGSLRWSAGPYEPGDYELWVRSPPDAGGAFRVDLQLSPYITHDTCATARTVEFDGGTFVDTFDLRYAGQVQAICQSADNNHTAHYRLSTRGLGERSLTLETSGVGFHPELTVANVCAPWVPEEDLLWCGVYSLVGGVDFPRLPEGDYFLQLTHGTGGPTRLEATLGPPHPQPSNDTCADAGVVDLRVTPSVTVSGDTRGAGTDVVVCAESRSRDVVYRVVPPTNRGVLDLEVTATSAEFDPRIQVNSGASCTGGSCFNASDGGTEAARRQLDWNDTSVIVYVAGARLHGGTFDLTATYTAPPADDVCGATVPQLPLPGTVTGDVNGYYPDDTGCLMANGNDRFYRLTNAGNTARVITLTLKPSGFDGDLSVLSACSGSGTCVGHVDAVYWGDETLTFTAAKATSYYVVVGGSGTTGTAGTFELMVQ